jgi:DNA primase
VTIELTKKYQWYVAEINGFEYLVMPILREGKAVCYSARALDKEAPKKYHYHRGAKREYWLSDDTLERSPIFLCEGVSDAVALSPYGSSVGLLGGSYDGSLSALLKDRKVIVAFDGDFAGICLGAQVASKIAGICQVSLCTYEGKDPADWTTDHVEASLR